MASSTLTTQPIVNYSEDKGDNKKEDTRELEEGKDVIISDSVETETGKPGEEDESGATNLENKKSSKQEKKVQLAVKAI